MSKKSKAQPVVEVKQPKAYVIDGVTYTEDDPLQVITPELGLISITNWHFQSYSTTGIVDFDLGWIKTPLPCGDWKDKEGNKHNARIALTCTRLAPSNSSNGSNYNQLRLIYFCFCRHGTHTENFRWNVTLENGIIRANKIGWDHHNKPHNHPLVEGYENLKPAPIIYLPKPVLAPEFKPVQLDLFA